MFQALNYNNEKKRKNEEDLYNGIGTNKKLCEEIPWNDDLFFDKDFKLFEDTENIFQMDNKIGDNERTFNDNLLFNEFFDEYSHSDLDLGDSISSEIMSPLDSSENESSSTDYCSNIIASYHPMCQRNLAPSNNNINNDNNIFNNITIDNQNNSIFDHNSFNIPTQFLFMNNNNPLGVGGNQYPQLSFETSTMPTIYTEILLQSTPPKNHQDENLLSNSQHPIYKEDNLVCYYCGNLFNKKDKLKDIVTHMEQCCKKTGKLLIPIFQYKNKQGEVRNAFIKDNFQIGLNPKLFKKLKNKFKHKLKSNVLDLVEPKHPLFNKIPKTFKNPTNNKVAIYEFDRFSRSIADEILFGISYSFVNTHLLIE